MFSLLQEINHLAFKKLPGEVSAYLDLRCIDRKSKDCSIQSTKYSNPLEHKMKNIEPVGRCNLLSRNVAAVPRIIFDIKPVFTNSM